MGFSDRLKPSQDIVVNDERSRLNETEKREATERNEPWVSVLDMKVNPDNIKNGFFELDWNEQFIELLISEGYMGESQEEIVEHWFNSVISDMLSEDGIDEPVKSGNVATFLKK